jgi:hypothetical protein
MFNWYGYLYLRCTTDNLWYIPAWLVIIATIWSNITSSSIRSPKLDHFMTESLYPLTIISPFSPSTQLFAGKHFSGLYFYESTFLRFTMSETIQNLSSCSWFISFISSRFTHVTNGRVSFFFWWYNIPLCKGNILSLSIHFFKPCIFWNSLHFYLSSLKTMCFGTLSGQWCSKYSFPCIIQEHVFCDWW